MSHSRSLSGLLLAATLFASACSGSVFTLAVGTCFDDEGLSSEVTDVPVVDCDEPHDNEVFHVFDLPDGDWPGDEAVLDAADEVCLGSAFADFVGTAYLDSEVDAFSITPTQGSWEQADDREVICAAWVPGERPTGTLAGAGR